MIKHFMKYKTQFYTTMLFVMVLFLDASLAQATPRYSVDALWPTAEAVVTGSSVFSTRLNGYGTRNPYSMYWQVDGDVYNPMTPTSSGGYHYIANVDVTTWTWDADGIYTITFVAKTPRGAIIASKSVVIHVPVVPVVSASTNPLADATFYVDSDSAAADQVASWRSTNPTNAALLERISSQPVAFWMGDWYSDIQSTADDYTTTVTDAGDLPVFVAYNIPHRDCGYYSSGGVADAAAYQTWIQDFADGIGSRAAVVILEPDAAALTSCLTATQTTDRLAMLSNAVTVLKSKGNISVYIDAGNANWIGASTMAATLTRAGIAAADGFSLNVSSFYTNAQSITYGETLSALVGDKHFVIDTSRNGNGSNGEWCNPAGRLIGTAPTTATGNELVDAFLWVKVPGESDGTCNGGPDAGSFWLDYAMDLVS